MGIGRWFGLVSGRAFGRDRRGNVAMMWGIMGAVLIGTIGIAVDFTRAQGIRARMQNAVDGAALVAERSSNLTMTQREAAARAFFDSEMGDQAGTVTLTVTQMGNGGHRVTANMPMPTTIARVVRREDWDIAVSAEAQASASPPIEVALVLDNTGSMSNDMQGLRDAAEDLAEYLMRIDGDSVSVALVPFVAQVNIGTGATQMGWMDTAAANPHHGEFLEDRELLRRPAVNNACVNAQRFPTTVANAPLQSNNNNAAYQVRWVRQGVTCIAYNPTTINMFDIYNRVGNTNGWGGCVEARPPPYDIQDTAPTPGTPATMFVPYFADDEGDDDTDDNNWLTDNANLLNAGNTNGVVNSANARTLNFFKYRTGVGTNLSFNQPDMRGPQRGCARPIVPLTTDENAMVTAIRGMVHSNGGGTNQAEGLAWGWRVLSPTPPFTQGRDPGTSEVRKVIVLMTDGENTSLDNGNAAFESDYSSYQHRRLWRDYQFNLLAFLLGGPAAILPQWQRPNITNESSMVNYINQREEALCTAIKNANIEIYTIQFRDTDTDNRNRLLNCSSLPHTGPGGHFYTAANAAQLQAAFTAIGSGIGQLRLTQ